MRARIAVLSTTMPFEHKNEPAATPEVYRRRLWRYFLISFGMLTVSLAIGMAGYKWIVEVKGWDDAFLNASMILTGMGPILDPDLKLTAAGKIFSRRAADKFSSARRRG